jgi:hypothetical protein
MIKSNISYFGPKSKPISPIATIFGCCKHRSISFVEVSVHAELQCGWIPHEP